MVICSQVGSVKAEHKLLWLSFSTRSALPRVTAAREPPAVPGYVPGGFLESGSHPWLLLLGSTRRSPAGTRCAPRVGTQHVPELTAPYETRGAPREPRAWSWLRAAHFQKTCGQLHQKKEKFGVYLTSHIFPLPRKCLFSFSLASWEGGELAVQLIPPRGCFNFGVV